MRAFALTLVLLLAAAPATAQELRKSHALSLFGDIKYGPDFAHFDYVNPNAPKGGSVRMSADGTFDSLNPFVIKGRPGAGSSLIYDTLLDGSRDEPSTEYGLIAESVEVPDDLSSVIYNLRPQARWHDGTRLTAEDVAYTFELLKTRGRPIYRYYYANIERAEVLGPHRVQFHFTGPPNRELPLITGQLSILPKHYWQGRDFEATTLEPPLGSGPYRIGKVDPGRSLTVERVADYWGRDLPVNKGRWNYDSIRFEYYRDSTVTLEAFKAHDFDFRMENIAKVWATGYDFPAVKDRRVIVEKIPDRSVSAMQAFVFNIRRPKFQDRRVREALGLTFDFEWSNRTLFFDQYQRLRSYFDNSELASHAPPDAAELALLEPLRGQIPDEVFTTPFQPPSSEGTRRGLRANLRQAAKLLEQAGWTVVDGKLTNAATGQSMTIEFLTAQATTERVVSPMLRNMERLGIETSLRIVDTSQYTNRVRSFDFDMITGGWGQSLSPGNEQRDFWGSAAATREGSRNLVGIQDKAVDALIDHVIYAKDRAGLIAATRALDRVLLWNHFVIPNYTLAFYRVAYWNRFGRPQVLPKYGIGFTDTWWIDRQKDTALTAKTGKR